MKRMKKWISILCALLLIFPLSVAATETIEDALVEQTEEVVVSVTSNPNEVIIYDFLKNELGLNTAAICGILANLYKESSFNPTAFNGNDTGNTQSYGFCQWNSGAGAGNRYKQLRDWCAANGYDYTTAEGQLNFMKYELKTVSYYKLSYLQNYIENTPEGAYEASKLWSKYYEGCNKKYHEERAVLARDTYWAIYLEHPDTTMTISNHSKPNMLKLGENFTVTGTIQSVNPLTKVTVSIYNGAGSLVSVYNAAPDAQTYDLTELGTALDFSQLKAGTYYYRVYASDANETVLLTNKGFVVGTDSSTVTEGIYRIYASQNKNYVLDIASSSNKSGANVSLDKKASTLYQMFEIKYVGNGYYTIMNIASEKYLEVTDSGTAHGTNVQMGEKNGKASQNWQILSLGTGYCFVPECAPETCLDLENGSASANLNVQIGTTSLGESQKFGLTTVDLASMTKGELAVEDVSGEQGTTIEVPITLEENLGIEKLEVSMSYDSTKLKLVEIVNGTLFELSAADGVYYEENPYTIVWDGRLQENLCVTGKMGVAVFEVLPTAKAGDTAIEVSVEAASDYKGQSISIAKTSGTVEVLCTEAGIKGDVNGDGEIKLNDALLLRRYVAGYDVQIDLAASDVNGDGEVKLNDALLLRRYVAGYDVNLQ